MPTSHRCSSYCPPSSTTDDHFRTPCSHRWSGTEEIDHESSSSQRVSQWVVLSTGSSLLLNLEEFFFSSQKQTLHQNPLLHCIKCPDRDAILVIIQHPTTEVQRKPVHQTLYIARMLESKIEWKEVSHQWPCSAKVVGTWSRGQVHELFSSMLLSCHDTIILSHKCSNIIIKKTTHKHRFI